MKFPRLIRFFLLSLVVLALLCAPVFAGEGGGGSGGDESTGFGNEPGDESTGFGNEPGSPETGSSGGSDGSPSPTPLAPGNNAPVLNPIGNKNINEGQLLQFTVTASDPDSNPVTITASSLPSGASFNGAAFSWTPGFSQSGVYSVTFTASDGSLTDSETITITVNEASSVVSSSDDALEQVLIKSVAFPDEDFAAAGKELVALVNIENDGNRDLDDVRIRAYILEEGIVTVSEPFDLDANYPASKELLFKLPKDVEEGWHAIGFSVYNGDTRRVVYRDIYIQGRQ